LLISRPQLWTWKSQPISQPQTQTQPQPQPHPFHRQAYDWVQANKQSFQQPVVGPLLLEINVLSQEHAAVLEQQCRGFFAHFLVSTKWVSRSA
jgi:hypothetical protein